jgi:hypothetical protein
MSLSLGLLCLWSLGFVSCQQQTACDVLSSNSSDRRSDKSRLRIVSFNAEFLFLVNWRTPLAPDGPWKSLKDAQQHAATVAKEIDALDADVVVVLEAEGCAAVHYVRLLLRAPGAWRVFLVPGLDSATGQEIVLLTRVDPLLLWRTDDRVPWPVSGGKCGFKGASETTTVSKNLFARFAASPGFPPFVLAACHLIAFPTSPQRCSQREAQALVMKGAVKKALSAAPGSAVVLVGDLNDLDPSFPDADESDSPTSRVLATLKSSVTPRLTATWESVAESDRWSTCDSNCRSPRCSAIDHILLSKELVELAVDLGATRRNKTCAEDRGVLASDHVPVFVTLRSKSAAVSTLTDATATSASSPSSDQATAATRTDATTAAGRIGEGVAKSCADIATCNECATSATLSCKWCTHASLNGSEQSRCIEPDAECGDDSTLLTPDECDSVRAVTCSDLNQILRGCRACVDNLLACSWCAPSRRCGAVDAPSCATDALTDFAACDAAAQQSVAPALPVPEARLPDWGLGLVAALVALVLLVAAALLFYCFRVSKARQRARELHLWAKESGAQAIPMTPVAPRAPAAAPVAPVAHVAPVAALPPIRGVRELPPLTPSLPAPPKIALPPLNPQRCRALFAFSSDTPGDLSFREGQVITLIDSSLSWFKGKLDNRVGVFPSVRGFQSFDRLFVSPESTLELRGNDLVSNIESASVRCGVGIRFVERSRARVFCVCCGNNKICINLGLRRRRDVFAQLLNSLRRRRLGLGGFFLRHLVHDDDQTHHTDQQQDATDRNHCDHPHLEA